MIVTTEPTLTFLYLILDCRVVKIESRSILATETGGPVANTADRIEGQFVGAGVLGSDHLAVHHTGAGDELLARVRMREVTLVQATYRAFAREEELGVEGGLANDERYFVLVIIVVDHRRSSGSRGGVHRRPLFRPRSLAAPEVGIVARDRDTGRGIGSRCYGGAYLAPQCVS